MNESESNKGLTIRDLYPHLNEEQLKEAEENLQRYLEIVLHIYDRIRQDAEAYSQLKAALTACGRDPTMKGQKVESLLQLFS